MAAPRFKIEQIVKVSKDDRYNAFTDLKWFNGNFYCAFRTATAHVAEDGIITIMKSEDGINWSEHQILSMEHLDLRDPRLSVIKNKLYLTFFTSKYKPDGKTPSRTIIGHGDNFIYRLNNIENHWEKVAQVPYKDVPVVFWGLIEADTKIFVTAYSPIKRQYIGYLYETDENFKTWNLHSKFDSAEISGTKGITEIDPILTSDNKLFLFARIDSNPKRELESVTSMTKEELKKRKEIFKQRAKIAGEKIIFGKIISPEYFSILSAQSPYSNWEIKRHNMYFKGPRAYPWKNGFIVVGRMLVKEKSQRFLKDINVLFYDPNSDKFSHLATLARGIDGSYAGLTQDPSLPNILWISFYSDHERINTPKKRKANDIWIAKCILS